MSGAEQTEIAGVGAAAERERKDVIHLHHMPGAATAPAAPVHVAAAAPVALPDLPFDRGRDGAAAHPVLRRRGAVLPAALRLRRRRSCGCAGPYGRRTAAVLGVRLRLRLRWRSYAACRRRLPLGRLSRSGIRLRRIRRRRSAGSGRRIGAFRCLLRHGSGSGGSGRRCGRLRYDGAAVFRVRLHLRWRSRDPCRHGGRPRRRRCGVGRGRFLRRRRLARYAGPLRRCSVAVFGVARRLRWRSCAARRRSVRLRRGGV